MATVVNNPGTTDSSGGMGFLLGAILLVAVVFLFLYFGLPALNRAGSTVNVNPGGEAPQINIPDKVDVNINNPQQ